VITGVRISRNFSHDLIQPARCCGSVTEPGDRPATVLDKGYDAEDLHELIREDLRSFSLIPVRDRKRKRIGRKYRRQLSREFDERTYHRRCLIETAFSVLKRRFGETRITQSIILVRQISDLP
jgi:hypothetical protein